MRHSASPRSMSTRRNVKRPAWSAERRLQRATSRTGPSVSAAPLAMCCILCSHGSFVHPPSAKTAHRATIYAQTAGLVPARGARPAVAPHARSVPRARVRVHAAADAGEPRGAVLSEIPRAIPRSRGAGTRQAAGRKGGVGWAGILCEGEESSQACEAGCREKRCRRRRCQVTGGAGGADQVAGGRTVYGRCRGELRIREAGAGGRHQRRPGDPQSVWKRETRNAERGTVAVGAGARAEEWQTSVEVQSSRDGAGSGDLRGAETEVPRVPGAAGVQNRQSPPIIVPCPT